MTTYGADFSHYDGTVDGARLVAEGFSFTTHKAGGDQVDSTIGAWWQAVSPHRGPLLPGAYWVLYPGNPTSRADAFLARLDATCPGWRGAPFLLQADCERWNNDSGTQPGVGDIKAFCDRLAAQAKGLIPVVYASRGQYGDQLAGLGYPLWNADYPSSMAGPASSIYAHIGGDSGPGWASYSGQTPAIWQFTSAATIAGLTTCDANAYRGTLAELTSLVAPGWETDMPLTPDDLNAIATAVWNTNVGNATQSYTAHGALFDATNRAASLANIQVPALASAVGGLADPKATAAALAPALAAALAPLLPTAPAITPAELEAGLVAAFRQLAATPAPAAPAA